MRKLPVFLAVLITTLSVTLAIALQPTPGADDHSITISTTVILGSATTLNLATAAVIWTVADADIRVTFNGVTPSATVGHLIKANSSGTWSKDLLATAKFIRAGAADAVLTASEVY